MQNNNEPNWKKLYFLQVLVLGVLVVLFYLLTNAYS